jgi:hypothetical protein
LTQGDDSDIEESSPVKKSSKKAKAQKPKYTNKFLAMPEMNMHKDDVEFDKKIRRLDKVPRREKFEPVKVRCRVCGKDEIIDGSLVESNERYKCNKCSSSAG